MKVALIGFGHVGKALAGILARYPDRFPLRITGILTRHGMAVEPAGVPLGAGLGPVRATVEGFLQASGAEAMCELTTLNPASGEPAISHIRAAFRLGLHAVTANKGPVAYAYAALSKEALSAGREFRFESTVMDGAPVFNLMRRTMPGVVVQGFTGVLNSTTKIVIEAMREGHSFESGIQRAQQMGITEADYSYDTDGWDAAVKTAALANVLLDAGVTPANVETRGIGQLTAEKLLDLKAKGKTVCLVSRAKRGKGGWKLRVRGEVLAETDLLASVRGTSNLILFHTDLMGTFGTVSIEPTPRQTAYGVVSDLMEILRTRPA